MFAKASSARLSQLAVRLEAAWAPLIEIALETLKDTEVPVNRSVNYTLHTDMDDEPDEDDTIDDTPSNLYT